MRDANRKDREYIRQARRYPDELVKSNKESDAKYNLGDDMYVADYGTRMEIHNQAHDMLVSKNIDFDVVTQNSFKFSIGRNSFMYYAVSKKWRPLRSGAPTYHCKNLEALLEKLLA